MRLLKALKRAKAVVDVVAAGDPVLRQKAAPIDLAQIQVSGTQLFGK